MKAKFWNRHILNVSNALTVSRIIIAFLIIIMALNQASLASIAIVFFIGMLTDFFDGWIARIFDMKTKFGARFDIVADRILVAAAVISILAYYLPRGLIDGFKTAQIIMIISREIIAFPVALCSFILRKPVIIKAEKIGKAATALQAFAFPLILIGSGFSIYIAAAAMTVGIIAGVVYDLKILKKLKT